MAPPTQAPPRDAARDEPRARVRIDPRLRERRVAVQRAAGRKRLRRLLVGLAVIAGLAALAAATFTPLADVDTVVVAGAAHTGADPVRDAAAVAGRPVLWFDADAAAARVEALPWVDTATVHRELPATVRIEVRERTPIAFVALDGYSVLVDERGRVLTTIAPDAVDRPRVELTAVGTVPAPGATLEHLAAVDVAARLTGPLAERARVVQGEPLVVFLDDATEVRLGDATDVAQKIEAADAVLHARGDAPFRYIDVRVPSAPAVGR